MTRQCKFGWQDIIFEESFSMHEIVEFLGIEGVPKLCFIGG